MGRRLHCWVYGLWYPALLGTFLVTLLIRPGEAGREPWGWLLVIYFTLQHVEGTLDSASYDLRRFLIDDVLEMALMVFSFAKLFPTSLPLVERLIGWIALPWILLGVFALPPLYRWFFERAKLDGGHAAFYWLVTALSLIAMGATVGWGFGWIGEATAFYVILPLLVIYGLVFVVFNEPIAKRARWLERPADPA